MQTRSDKGRFQNKSKTERKVRSIRATDDVWKRLGNIAKERNMTRADLIESVVYHHRVLHSKNNRVIHGDIENIKVLKEALKLKANAGGKIKEKIRQYLKSIYP